MCNKKIFFFGRFGILFYIITSVIIGITEA